MTTATTPDRRQAHCHGNRLDRFEPLFDRTSSPLAFEAGDTNLFRYVGNSPAEHVDPDGLREGHHWFPTKVREAVKGQLSQGAYALLKKGTLDPLAYDHAYDTWDGVTHGQYSDAVQVLYDKYKAMYSRRSRISPAQAEEFLSWISGASEPNSGFASSCDDVADALSTVRRWRKGFLRSITVARAAMDVNSRLSSEEAKAIAKRWVNNDETVKLTWRASRAMKATKALGKAGMLRAAKKIVPFLVAFSYATSAARGFAGEGHCSSGVVGAGHEVVRDLVMADLVEGIAFPAAEAGTDYIESVLNTTRGRERVQLRRRVEGVDQYGRSTD